MGGGEDLDDFSLLTSARCEPVTIQTLPYLSFRPLIIIQLQCGTGTRAPATGYRYSSNENAHTIDPCPIKVIWAFSRHCVLALLSTTDTGTSTAL